jgi:hypothetical protein
MRHALGAGHDIEVIVHSVDEENVSHPGWAKHDLGAGGSPPPGAVGREVFGAPVSLGFHDPTGKN